MDKKRLSKYVEQVFETPGDFSEWFGYYNYDTLSIDNAKMLCNRSDIDGIAVKKGMTIELGYYDIQKEEWNHVGNSDSWNWQQGSMMQWLPGDGNDGKIIYNCSKKDRLISVIYNSNTGTSSELSWPIYGITPDGKRSISLNLERSYWCRAYHYESVANKEYDTPIPTDDGIFEINLETNTRRRIVSIEDVLKMDPDPNFYSLKHWFEHIMINPQGTKFVFLHRFSPIDNVYAYDTRMIIADIDGSNLHVVKGWRDFNWSHFGWQNENSFAMYSVEITGAQKSLTNAIKSSSYNTRAALPKVKKCILNFAKTHLPDFLRRKLKGNRSCYQHYIYKDNSYVIDTKFSSKLLSIDGHPSFTKDGRFMITDTYPAPDGYRRLIVFDTCTKKSLILAELFAGLNNTPARCDLHPKLSRDNNYVVVDTAYTGKHRMIMLKLKWNDIKDLLSK